MSVSAGPSERVQRLGAELARAVQGDLLRDEPMSRHTSFQVGGPADLFLQPASERDLVLAVSLARAAGLPVTLVGRGSNLLVDDLGIRGLTVKVGRGTDAIVVDGAQVVAGAGVSMGQLATSAARAGLGGMEFGILVPGNLGGGIFMNAGARGQEIRDVVRSVRVLNAHGEVREIAAPECGFSYRHSRFQLSGEVILGAVLDLTPDTPDAIETKMSAIQENRKRTMPVGFPSGGATFKRPPGDFAGRLIEGAGCKGWRVGGVHVSALHANYFINDRRATAADVRELMARVHDRVLAFHGVDLVREVVFAGGTRGWDLPYGRLDAL
jgi:UDP-N-acetylmuramate dehydrogenase